MFLPLSKIVSGIFEYIVYIITAFIIHEQVNLECDLSTMKNQRTAHLIMASFILLGVSKFIAFSLKLTDNAKQKIEYWTCRTKFWDFFSDITDLGGLCIQIWIAILFYSNKETWQTKLQMACAALCVLFKLIQRIIKWSAFCKKSNQQGYSKF